MKKISTKEIYETIESTVNSENYGALILSFKKNPNSDTVKGAAGLVCQDGDEHILFGAISNILGINTNDEQYNNVSHVIQSAFKDTLIQIKLGNPQFLHLLDGVDEIVNESLKERQEKETQSKYMSYLED